MYTLPFLLPVTYQMEMMRNLRHVNVDHLHVGWYQSTYYGSFINKNFLDSQFNYQSSIEESIVLIYGESLLRPVLVLFKWVYWSLYMPESFGLELFTVGNI